MVEMSLQRQIQWSIVSFVWYVELFHKLRWVSDRIPARAP